MLLTDSRNPLANAPVVCSPRDGGGYILDTDASDYALGAVLQQRQDGKVVVIAYASHGLDAAERSYCTTRKELLAIIYGLRKFRHYLLGQPFELRTDHAALTTIFKRMMARHTSQVRLRASPPRRSSTPQRRRDESAVV